MDDASQLSPRWKSERDEVLIRPMAAGDAPAVAQMARELAAAVDDPEPVLDARDLVRDGMGTDRWFDCLVAVCNGRVIGYAMLCRGYEAHIGKRRLWLSDLYVRAHARRIGAGRALMIAVAHQATTQGCDSVYWDLWRLNRGGRAFYESLGAVEIGDLAIWHVASRRLAATSDRKP
jgi:GNAT superfamily N-acetyltransferase